MPITSPPHPHASGRWPFIAFLLLALGIAAIWYSAVSAYEQAVLRERGRELQATAELKIEFIRFWLDERRGDAAVQSSRPLLAIAASGKRGNDWPYGIDALPGQLEQIRKEYGYEAVLLLDPQGHVRVSAGTLGESALDAAGKAGRAAVRSRDTTITRAYETSVEGGRHIDLDIASPVIDIRHHDRPIVGSLVFHLDPRAHLDPFLHRWPSPSESGETFLFERSGNALFYLSSLKFADAAQLVRQADAYHLPAALAARGYQGIVEGIDYRGVPVLAAVGQIPGMPWFIVSKIDRAEVLAPVRREALWSGSLTLALVAALGLATFSWWRRNQSALTLARETAGRAALAASEARFRKLHEHGSDINLLFDRNMVIQYASRSADRYLGRPAVGEPIASGTAKVHPDDVASVEAARREALARPGEPQRVQHRFLKEDGSSWTVEATFTSLFDDPDIGGLSYEARDITARIEAEQAMGEKARLQDQLVMVAASVPGLICSFQQDQDGAPSFPYASPAAMEVYGLPPEALIQDAGQVFERIHPDDLASLKTGIARSARELTPWHDEWRYHHPLKGERWLEGRSMPERLAEGSTRWHGFIMDITERKRFETALRESEERYRFLFENSPLPMWVYDCESLGFVEVNKTAMAQYGYSREEFLAMTLRDIRPPEEVCAMEAVARTDSRPQGRIWTHRRKDGSLIQVAIWSQDTPFFGKPARMVLAENVTARVEAELALAESEARLRAIFDSAPVGIAIAGPDGRYLMVNRAHCEMLGYSEAELLQRTFSDITHPEDVQANLDLRNRLLQGEISVGSMEKRYVRKDGHVFWVLITFSLVRTASGEVIGSVGVAQDITELREAEARRLEYARQQRDALVREVHHRIKNHLQGLAGLLRQHMNEQPSLEPMLQKFSAQIGTISIVHGLQGRAETGEASLRNLAQEIASFLSGIMGAPLPFHFPDHACLWKVAEDEAVPVALILNELLTNALRHGEDRARVSLEMRCEPGGAMLLIRNPGRLGAGLDFAGGKGLGTGLNLIRSLLPPDGAALRLENREDGWVETCLEVFPPVLQPMDQVVSLR